MAEKKRRRRDSAMDEIADYAIYLDDVSKTFSDGVPALSNINLKVKQGEFVFIVGVSGAGKSTLIKLLLRELKADSGTIFVNGYNLMTIKHGRIPKFRRTLGVVFQDFRLLKDRNVYENVAFAQRIAQKSEREIRSNVPSMLSLVGLAGKYKAKPKQLAGGEQQRVAIARALVNQPKLLLADEPTGNLDLYNTQEIMRLLETINENGTTVVVVTHNEKLVNEMKKRVVTIRQGMIVSDAENGGYFDED
ncbi:MAG: cell division ATP-binding protein FtsE [Lachnospiraceae bacterium]|nr:cell division ATP-binding protein FtsE [Lachnospiraceae bacterium]MBP5529581.1 cell division ATP-binding protein FtsE [Lachnospiraceae bacterium]